MEWLTLAQHFHLEIVPLESLWEGAKILVADWINHLPYVGDWRAKSTNQINEVYDVITEASRQAHQVKQHVGTGSLPKASFPPRKASSAAFCSSFREGILSNSAKTCSIAAAHLDHIRGSRHVVLDWRVAPHCVHTLTRLKTNADWPIVWRSAPNYFCRAMPVWTVSGISWSSRDQAGLTRLLPHATSVGFCWGPLRQRTQVAFEEGVYWKLYLP